MTQETDTEDSDAEYQWSAQIETGTLAEMTAAVAAVADDAVVTASPGGLVVVGTNDEHCVGVRADLPIDAAAVWDFDPPGEPVEVECAAADLHAPLTWFFETAYDNYHRHPPDAITLVCQDVPVGEAGRRPVIDVVAAPESRPLDVTYEATVEGYERAAVARPPDPPDGHAGTVTVRGDWLADAIGYVAGDPPPSEEYCAAAPPRSMHPDDCRLAVGYEPGPDHLVLRGATPTGLRTVRRPAEDCPAARTPALAAWAAYATEYVELLAAALPGRNVTLAFGEHWPLVAEFAPGGGHGGSVAVTVAPRTDTSEGATAEVLPDDAE